MGEETANYGAPEMADMELFRYVRTREFHYNLFFAFGGIAGVAKSLTWVEPIPVTKRENLL